MKIRRCFPPQSDGLPGTSRKRRQSLLGCCLLTSCLLATGCDSKTAVNTTPNPPVPVQRADTSTPAWPPNPLLELPPSISQAWSKAGASNIEWLQCSEFGSVLWVDTTLASPRDTPAFIFENGWNPALNGPLPDPGVPYGIVVRRLDDPDASLPSLLATLPVKHLKALDLRSTGVSDAGVPSLGSLHSLEVLSLGQTKITDAGLVSLLPLNNLKCLDLGDATTVIAGTPIKDEGLATLGKIGSLRFVSLTGSSITDRGLIHLKALKELEGLGLFRTLISPVGLESIVGLEELQHLNLCSTAVRDDAAALFKMKGLKTLHLESSFDPAKLHQLKKALSDCTIELR